MAIADILVISNIAMFVSDANTLICVFPISEMKYGALETEICVHL